MNEQLLTLLGIDTELSIEDRLVALEEKQFEYIEREQSANDPSRKEELTEIIHKIEKEIELLKESLKEINSAIILDSGEEEEVSVSEVEKEHNKKDSDTEINQRIEALKQKEAERKAAVTEPTSEESGNPSQGDDDSDTDDNSDSNKEFAINNNNVSADDERFKRAIREYNAGNYQVAMKLFEELAKAGDMDAQYTVGGMYLYSKDIPNDPERGLFWMKKAADQGHTLAQHQYGDTIILNAANNNKKLKEGFKYLSLAANKGDMDAMKDYVNAVLNNSVKKSYIKQAITYCKTIKKTTSDPYEAEQCKGFIKELRKRKRSGSGSGSIGCGGGCLWTLIKWAIILALVYALISSYLSYVEKSKQKADNFKNSSTEQSDTENNFGEEIIEAHSLTPVDSALLTLEADYGHVVDGSLWDGAFVYRAGNGDDTAYAVYELKGLFETITLEATSTFGTGSFFENSSADIMLIDAETNNVLMTRTIKSDSGVLNIQTDITGINKLGIYVKQTSSGLGDLAYVFVRNVYFYPVGQGSEANTILRINGNIRENAGTEYAVLFAVSGEEFVATGKEVTAADGGIWYEIYTDESKTETGWVHSSIIMQ